jgi:hypothetical protein
MTLKDNDTNRLGTCLRRLLLYLDADTVALTGGVAIELHLATRGLPRHSRITNDVDFVSQRYDADARRTASSATRRGWMARGFRRGWTRTNFGRVLLYEGLWEAEIASPGRERV